MNRIQRHIFASVAGASIAAVGFFVFVLMTGRTLRDIADALASGFLSWDMFARMLLLMVPFLASYALPLGIVSGILFVLGRMSANREIVAMKAAGMSIWSIASPILAFALLGMGAALFVNYVYAPRAKAEYRQSLANVVRDDPLRFVQPGAFIDVFPGYVIYAAAKSGDALDDLWIWELDDESRAIKLLRAETGRLRYDPAADSLVLTLTRGFTELRSESDPDNLQVIRPTPSFGSARIRLSLAALVEGARRVRLSDLDAWQLRERGAELRSALRELDAPAAASAESTTDDAVSGGATADPDTEAADRREDLRREWVRTEMNFHEKAAMAVSIVSLTLVAIPLGIRVGRKESHANVALALGLAMAYYFLSVVAGWTEGHPDLRSQAILWLPNLAFQAMGLTLLLQARKH